MRTERHVGVGVTSETAEYFQQTTLQLPPSDTTQHQQQQQQRDGRQSATGSQTVLTAASSSSAAAAAPTGSGDVVINIDERQPLICRSDHILTIDTVSYRLVNSHLSLYSVN